MNEKAKLLGMENSHFINPHGLDDGEGHYSSANDMAKLTAYALNNPIFQEIVKTKQKKVPNPNENWDYNWFNKNKMLGLFEGADGVKTGYTVLAKRCLVSSATRGGQQLAAVTLNDPSDWADHARLLTYGLENFPLQPLVDKGMTIEGSQRIAGQSFSYPLYKEETGLISKEVKEIGLETTAYRLGERGSLVIKLDGKPIGTVPLFASDSPRLNMEDKTTFSFKQSEVVKASFLSKYLFVLQMTLRMVFTPVKHVDLD
ncbi:D-alanyl-D-alanine carboxypeptidase DacB precursor [compost metagenome]